MYSDRMCKTKASSTQGSFCKPINLIFLRRQRRFFHFFAAGSSGNSARSILRSAVLGTVIFFRGNKHTRNGIKRLPVVGKARPALAAVGRKALGKFAVFQLTNYIILLTVRRRAQVNNILCGHSACCSNKFICRARRFTARRRLFNLGCKQACFGVNRLPVI